MNKKLETQQKLICKKYGSPYQPCDLDLKVGISEAVRKGVQPIHGERVKEENGTSGWYIYAGEYSADDDFFLPLHGHHLANWSELILPYLGLAEGWRFLITDTYEDVWKDPGVLEE